jgi:transposase-like protein
MQLAMRRVGRYPKEFRRMAVERLKACDNIVELSPGLGVHRRLLYKWRDQFDPFGNGEEPPPGNPRESTLRKEVNQLKRVLVDKTLELDFFKQPGLSTSCVLGSGMFSANIGCEIFIALQLVVLLHFIQRFAGGWSRRIEHPCAFGAAPAPKTLFFDPYQFAEHRLPSTSRDVVRLCPPLKLFDPAADGTYGHTAE